MLCLRHSVALGQAVLWTGPFAHNAYTWRTYIIVGIGPALVGQCSHTAVRSRTSLAPQGYMMNTGPSETPPTPTVPSI